MKEKKKEMQKQVLTLLGILIFAFVNVFIFDNKMGAGFSAFSTITDRKSTRLNSSHVKRSRMPSSA